MQKPSWRRPSERKDRRVAQSVFAEDQSKAHCEKVFLLVNLFSLSWFLAGVVATGLYEFCDRRHFAAIGILMGLPPWVAPAFFPSKEDLGRPLHLRFWFKANLWNAIFGFVGNYFWTHYFFSLLGARYTFDTYLFNGVPIPCYLVTHCYFCFYHTVSSIALRLVARRYRGQGRMRQALAVTGCVVCLSYITALMEALTISQFPYYDFDDRRAMYLVGSACYGLYFVVSFPMFWRMDESLRGERMSAYQACTEALAAAMVVTVLLDFWRLGVGSLDSLAPSGSTPPFVSPTNHPVIK